ncbi:MAG TPA: S8 family serine peptidase [Blastocatellia bacterium]|nr:S8 family serine peptidase [Blastocatellia bacterium]
MKNERRKPRAGSLGTSVVLLLCALLSGLSGKEARAQTPGEPTYRKGEVIVELKAGAKIADINARFGTTTIEWLYGTYLYRLQTPNQRKEKKFRKRLAKDPNVLSAALNPVVMSPISLFGRSTVGFPDGHAVLGQTRLQYSSQLLFAEMDAVRQRSTGTNILIAVIDTGVDLTHPDLAGHLWTNPKEIPGDGIDNDANGLIDDFDGWDFVKGTSNPSDTPGDPATTVAGHGTFIAGLIALMAPDAKILPVRAFDSQGVSDAFTVSQAIKYAADRGAQVINLSFGSADDSTLMHDAVRYAAERGSMLIAAVGNDNLNTDLDPQFPANWNSDVMGVAAVDALDHKADFSNFGSSVSISAPGVRLFSLYPQSGGNPQYAQWSGTSFAAPLAVAEAALILEKSSRGVDLRQIIENTATRIDDRNPSFKGLLGHGRLNPIDALTSLDPPVVDHTEIDLIPMDPQNSAQGHAEIDISGSTQVFKIDAHNVGPREHYSVIVDGVVVADDTITQASIANYFGSFNIQFSSQPDSEHLPLPPSMNPVTRIVHVEVLDDENIVLLTGDFRPISGGTGGGPSGQSFEKEARLTPTPLTPGAYGRAKVEIESQRSILEVEGSGLPSGQSFVVFADGVAVGPVIPVSGYFKARYTSDGSSGQVLPAALLPASKISRIEVRDPTSGVALQGTFQAGSGDIGGGGDDDGESRFTAAIQSLPAGSLIGDWVVGSTVVHVSQSTELRQDKGPFVVGATVEVRGAAQPDGSVNATRIEVEDSGSGGGGGTGGGGGGGSGGGESTRFTGTVEMLPPSGFIGDWVVSGKTVHVNSSTEIKQEHGNVMVGATVEVEGTTQSDGSVTASKIETKSDS